MKKIILIIMGMFSFISAQTIPNLPIPICSGTAEVINDSIYFFGGANRWAGSIRYSTVYKYDGNNWSFYDSIPDNSVWGIESVVVENDVYIFAGWPSGASLVRKFNVLDKTWSYLTPSSNTVEFGVTVAYVNDKIYLFNTTGSVREYDITNDSWQMKTSNTLPAYALSSVVYQDEIYFAGFYDSTFYKYNPSTDQWTQLGYFPFKVTKCAMGVIGDKIYCAGGSEQGSPMGQLNTLLEYDIASNSWQVDQFELSGKRIWMADVTYNDNFIVLGGLDTTGFAVDIVEEITPIGPVTKIEEAYFSPQNYSLNQNYPNPFNPTTKIEFIIPQTSFTSLKVYDLLGNEVTTLVNEYKPAGKHEIDFSANELTSGIYFYRLQSGSFIETKKMLLLK